MSKYTAFNYLTGSSIGIGLNLYSDSSTTLAYVSASPTAYQNNTTGEVYATAMTYTLSVNMNSVDLSTEEGRNALESTIAHEMIHAFMFEATTAGMFGLSSSGQTDSFPAWFVEGMAQTASGPGNWVHHGMGITPDSDTSAISSALASAPLTSSESNTTAQYGTGYLACMYLGYLASGADANLSSSTAAASEILSGLNTILGKIINGQSLDSVINEVTGGSYSSASTFASGFATDTNALNFIQDMAENGYFSTDSTPNDGYTSNVVSGGLISGNLLNGDPYPDDSLSLNLFALDSTNTAVKNEYPSDITVLSGGVVSADGVAPTDDMTPTTPSTGSFTVTGGTEGVDYTYDADTGTLTVLTDEAITIEGTGTATTDKIKINDGTNANVTIKNVNIDVSSAGGTAFEVGENSTVNLTLEGTNTLKSDLGSAGLQVEEGETLVITENSTGSLDATGGTQSAGIGGSSGGSSGTIEINGGTVTATGGDWAAGIGGGYGGSGGDIDINGGTVTATGGAYAAGIGGGDRGSSGGNIDISGGTVTATGGFEGSGIGGGVQGDGGNIVIDGGNVTATGGDWAAGIGGGSKGDGGNIEISGGNVTATGGSNAAAIGDGQNGSGGTFSTTENGTAVITVSNADGDTEIADLISDTSGIDVWSATINGVQYPLPLQGTGNINLDEIDGPVTITDNGYTIGDTTYVYTGDYTFTGTTDEDITVSSGGTTNITFDGVTGENFTVKGNSTVNLTVTNTSTVDNVTVENGSKLNIVSGTLNVTNKLDNDGTVENSGVLNNSGEIDNDGTVENSGVLNNSGGIDNDGDITNSGDITNNSGGTVENAGSVTNNNSGTVTNSGTLTNTDSGSISNSGDITNKSGGTVENAGSVTNNNGGTIDNSGTITNSGEITNADGGTIDNSGDIDSTGGTLTNNGEIKSRPDSNIDGTVGGANQPVDAPAKADDDDDDKDGDFEDGENIWIMQVGGRSKDTFAMDIGRMNTKILGVDKDSVNISTQASANAAIDKIGEAVNKLSRQRADIGAYQNRLEHKIDNLNVTRENLISAESKIRDTDMAVYMMEFTKNQILNNAAQAMLAQANSLPQSVLSLVQ